MGFLCRRSAWVDGSPGHRQIHGDGFLYRRTLHLESPEAGTKSNCRRSAGAARRLATGDARPEVPRNVLEKLGSHVDSQAAGDLGADDRPVRHQDVRDRPGLRVYGDTRVRAALPESGPDPARRSPSASVRRRDGCAMLAPNAEVSMFPWKEPKERIPLAVRQIRSFLRAHRPQAAKA